LLRWPVESDDLDLGGPPRSELLDRGRELLELDLVRDQGLQVEPSLLQQADRRGKYQRFLTDEPAE
jgi:hypothetical protein